jgi:signal transduction histidine kinase
MEELENYRTQLEYLVKERTEELEKTHERLLQQEKLATVGQLTATVGHELRNPLGTMRSSLYILQKVADTGQSSTARAIERLNRSVRRCDHIVDELLDFTRTKPLELRPVIVDAWVEEVLNEVPLPDNITVHKALGLADFSLKIDPDRLSRALINAIENGYQAMAEEDNQTPDSKTACLSIATSLTGQRVNITVSDTGPGIPDDVMERIFEPLFSTKNAGIGLGMPTMKQIMEQHHGGVEISTRPGKGTDVTLWLPRPDQKDSGPAESA